MLHRSLLRLRALIGRSLAEVRLTQGVQSQETIGLFDLIDEVGAASVLHADTIGIRLTVLPVDQDIAIEGDRQVLAAVVGNLLHNACKFTRPQTTITVRVRATAERALIEIEDECGGLPGENHDQWRHLRLGRQTLFTLEQSVRRRRRQTGGVVLFPRQPPRVYVDCPRCLTPHAFITIDRGESQCSFCPLCRYVWESVVSRPPARSRGEELTQPVGQALPR